MLMRKVRLLDDYPPWTKGQVVDVDPLRCARLVDDEAAEVLPDNWQPAAATSPDDGLPAAETTATPARATRRGRKGGA